MTETIITKVCTGCEEEKTLDQFHAHKEGKYGVNSRCKDCVKKYRASRYDETREASTAYTRQWRLDNPGRSQAANRAYYANNAEELAIRKVLSTYNITRERYEELTHSGACAVCGHKPTFEGKDRLYFDHNHACCPGKRSCGKCLREPLCNHCNLGLGHFKDNPLVLRAAAEYIERWMQV